METSTVEKVALALSNAKRFTPSLTLEDFRNMRDAVGTTSRTEWEQSTHQAQAALSALEPCDAEAVSEDEAVEIARQAIERGYAQNHFGPTAYAQRAVNALRAAGYRIVKGGAA